MRVFAAFCALLALLSTLSSPVLAADVAPPPYPPPAPPPYYPPPPYYAPVPPPAPIYNWSGIFVGVNGGGGWNQGTWSDSATGLTFGGTNTAGMLGAEVGANYQITNFVVGLEADFDWALNNGNTTTTFVPGLTTGPANVQVTANNRWVTLLDARLGFAAGRALFFVKGGGAWLGSSNSTFTNTATNVSLTSGGGSSNTGWNVGAGFEWGILPRMSAKVEYDYIGLSNQSFTIPVGVGGFPAGDTFSSNNRSMQMVLAGLNYRFGGGGWWGAPAW